MIVMIFSMIPIKGQTVDTDTLYLHVSCVYDSNSIYNNKMHYYFTYNDSIPDHQQWYPMKIENLNYDTNTKYVLLKDFDRNPNYDLRYGYSYKIIHYNILMDSVEILSSDTIHPHYDDHGLNDTSSFRFSVNDTCKSDYKIIVNLDSLYLSHPYDSIERIFDTLCIHYFPHSPEHGIFGINMNSTKDTIFMEGTSMTLSTRDDATSFKWTSNNDSTFLDTSRIITIHYPGIYYLEKNVSFYPDTIYDTITVIRDEFYLGSHCPGDTIVFNPSRTNSYDSYKWSSNVANGSSLSSSEDSLVFLTQTGTFSVTVTSDHMTLTETYKIFFYEKPTTPELCIVTLDSSMDKNKIVWTADNEPSLGDTSKNTIFYYNIYDENTGFLGSVSSDSDHVFIDMNSRPPYKSNTYRISSVDGCGTESNRSGSHTTILLMTGESVYEGEINLSWSAYENENDENFISKYYLYRGTSTSSFVLIDSTYFFNYVDSVSSNDNYYYQIEARSSSECNYAPNGSKGSKIIKYSRSNILHLNKNSNMVIDVYPNPTSGKCTLEMSVDKIEIFNAQGKLIKTLENTDEIDISKFPDGIYSIHLYNDYDECFGKIVKYTPK